MRELTHLSLIGIIITNVGKNSITKDGKLSKKHISSKKLVAQPKIQTIQIRTKFSSRNRS